MKVEITTQPGRAAELAERLAEGGLTTAAARALLRAAQRVEAEIVAEVRSRLTKYPRGALARSWRTTLERDRLELTATVASSLPYAAIQDTGGIVRPKRARMLAIPIRGPGGPRPGQGPRQFPGELHVQRTPKGRLILADKKGLARYVLRKSTEVPGVGYLAAALAASPPGAEFSVAFTDELAPLGVDDAE